MLAGCLAQFKRYPHQNVGGMDAGFAHHRLRLTAMRDDGCVIGSTSRMYSASDVQKLWA